MGTTGNVRDGIIPRFAGCVVAGGTNFDREKLRRQTTRAIPGSDRGAKQRWVYALATAVKVTFLTIDKPEWGIAGKCSTRFHVIKLGRGTMHRALRSIRLGREIRRIHQFS